MVPYYLPVDLRYYLLIYFEFNRCGFGVNWYGYVISAHSYVEYLAFFNLTEECLKSDKVV